MSNGIEIIQNKFLKFIWIMVQRDWTNELVIVGVILLGVLDIYKTEDPQLAYAVGGGLIGYLTRAGQEGLKDAGEILSK